MSLPDLDAIFKQYGDWWCKSKGGKCDRMNVVQPGFEDRRLVVGDGWIDYYGSPDTEMRPTIGARQTLSNGTNLEQSQTVELSKTTTSTFAWSLTEGFKLGAGLKFKVGVPPIASAETTFSAELNFSATQTKTESEQKTWRVSQPVKVPARSEVEAVLAIDEQSFRQRFHSRCVLSGFVCSNSPDRIEGHYFWFHHITDIIRRYPTPGFRIEGSKVHYEGDGVFEGKMGVRTRLNLTEKSLDNPRQLRSWSIVEPIAGAGIAGLHDKAAA
ncbi:ETX/MTX2 family pore-forming toxin [Amaricoccus sp.]|uniref:ETX/MTX2 family pore-forming toxin n=1 Tax=Amaricoccus sp. TaxID=1872485 RepID=UPI00260B4D37|nr:ETX/MTX2 family pore-forming toxin [Amaricoccus sp.]HRO11406.1 ETX/MTX2 family pore-forming toxin [Amaricoccus sp.]